ncbi:hypothetical protein DXG03_004634 [Asterophora parasitica]|uniref:BBC1/AIM3 cysteine proteinase-fold domain-containing protein n=1 Tax=Asterophora parasitica TaxID=117018 RepID=A0A9P7GFH1_9AGAR|nr:hypothetical protein DXG03_004634 [Asterophora parasitica]
MSEQSTPPRPKPGSLRDRIAAFEKPAAGGPAPGPAPAPRPKPGGLSWKPRQSSPPSSPSAADTSTERKAGGMSASDAKESIGKGVSLKERMAALQNKGAFGAPPPLAPKPALEKPKWKPPPVIAPVDKDDDDAPSHVEPPKSPPPPLRKVSIDKPVEDANVEESRAAVEDEDQGEVDREEEERQRRAAIAARMARLGGARVGMAPPLFGKPAAKKPEPSEELKPETPLVQNDEEDKSSNDNLPPPAAEEAAAVSPPSEVPSPLVEASNKSPTPERKDSAASALLFPDPDAPPPRTPPTSMPLPSAPRRTGPPRKKTPKTPEVPPPPPPTVLPDDTLVVTPETVPTLSEHDLVNTSAIVAESDEKAKAGDLEPEIGEVDEAEVEPVVTPLPVVDVDPAVLSTDFAPKEPSREESPDDNAKPSEAEVPKPIFEQERTPELQEEEPTESQHEEERTPELQGELAESQSEKLAESRHEGSLELKREEPSEPQPKEPAHVVEQPAPQHEGSSEREEPAQPEPQRDEPLDIAAPTQVTDTQDDAAIHDDDQLHERFPSAEETEERDDSPAAIETVEEAPPAQVADETEEDEEARRQRIAAKLAKMGGFNPFAPHPQPQRKSSSSDGAPSSPPPAKRASISQERVVSPPPPPQRRESTRKSSVDFPATIHEVQPVAEPAAPQPPSRKTTVDYTASELSTSVKLQDDSWQVSREPEPVASTGIPEETEANDATIDAADRDHKTHDGQNVASEYEETELPASELFEDVSDVEPEASATPPSVSNVATRPASILSAPLPARPAEAAPALPPARSLPPPPRLVPQPSESEEEAASESEGYGGYSPAPPAPPSPFSQAPSDNENDEPLRRLPHRSIPYGAEEESAPLPVPNRTSFDNERPTIHRPTARPFRSIPPPPTVSAPVSDVEQDSDYYDEVLPTPPRHRPVTPGTRPVTPGTPQANEIPLIVPPPTSDDASKPSPLRQATYPDFGTEQTVLAPVHTGSGEPSPSLLYPHPSSSDQEVLDEEEGDPIDPSFHSPSRRASTIILPPSNHPAGEHSAEAEQNEAAARRKTIAERMAKLGGIKFGAAPLPPSMYTSPPPREVEGTGISSADASEERVEPSEEEEERARKERIAAKLAVMGGMRIGMMPLGIGAVRPQQSHVLTEQTAPAPPSRGPPSRPPPPPQAYGSDAEPDSILAASQDSLATSDEGVKVEAEESEIEEVSYSDAQEPEEEIPPPVPARGPRRRGTAGSESEHRTTSPPPRPPVPSTLPNRRSSIQATTSAARKGSTGSSYSVQAPSAYKPQSEYVMVEEPSGFAQDEEIPPPPPARPTSRPPPRTAPPPPAPSSDNISSQWELPSIPTSGLDFGGTTDLSLSWPEDSNPAQSSSSPSSPIPPEKSAVQQQHAPDPDHPRSSDELIAVWGRVGVQICEVATTLFDKSKRSLVGDGTYHGFVYAVLSEVPNAVLPYSQASYGYLVYQQTGSSVQKRASEILPGDIMVLQEAKLKGHKGLQTYHQNVGVGEQLVGVVSEFEPKKSKIRLFQANQHVGQQVISARPNQRNTTNASSATQTVEAVSYRLEDLKSGTVKASSSVTVEQTFH